jgi:uncharacterized protein YuzE
MKGKMIDYDKEADVLYINFESLQHADFSVMDGNCFILTKLVV